MRIQLAKATSKPRVRRILVLTAAISLLVTSVSAQHFSDWSPPANLGPPVNTSATDGGAFVTKDGLSLYITSTRPGGFGGMDLWVAQRDSTEEVWGAPQNLGPTVNTSSNEVAPAISPNGSMLYFSSSRPGGFGSGDLYVSQRRHKRDDFGWETPVNLGSIINTSGNEAGPVLFNDDKAETLTLYFNSDVGGSADIYATTLQEDGQFGVPVLIQELSTPFVDQRPTIRRDGLEMIFDSNRPGGSGDLDLWVTTRASTCDLWREPENLGSQINTAAIEGRAGLSYDGKTLYFLSTRLGGLGLQDIYVSTRTKTKR